MNFSQNKLSQTSCEKLKGKEIDELLKKKHLPQYGTKKEKCKRLLKFKKESSKKDSNKCNSKKNEECKKKGKMCNPLTGRCIINKKLSKKKSKSSKPKKLTKNSNKCNSKKNEECKKKGKTCNPLTGRCIIRIKKNEKISSKKKMSIKNDIINAIKSITNKKPENKPKTLHKNIFIKDVIKAESKSPIFKELSKKTSLTKKNSKARRIQRFLRDKLIKNKYTLDNRVRFAKYLKSRLTDIKENDCIETKTFKNGSKGYTIKNVIDLVKKIGTESVFGVIYLSSIKESLGGYSIVTKTMSSNSDNLQEIKLMYKITEELLLTKKSKHFAAVYKYAKCSKKEIIRYDGKNDKRKAKEKLVSVNELAHGDLKTLLQNRDIAGDNKLLFNLLIQTFISIATFQNRINYIHFDAHHGNFLYQKNNDIGYYQYKFNDFTFYLKACGYNIIIYDFGLSRKVDSFQGINKNYYIKMDYYRISHAFLSSNRGGWGKWSDLPKKNVEDIIGRLIYELFNIKNTEYNNQGEYFKHLLKYIFKLSSFVSNDIIIHNKPKNVINKEPFII